MAYPTTLDQLLVFSAVVGAIAGTITGAAQYWIDRHLIYRDWKGWRSIISFIAWYPLIWSGLSVAFTPLNINLYRSYGLSSTYANVYAYVGEMTLEQSLMLVVIIPISYYFMPKWMDRKQRSPTDKSNDQN